MVIVCFTVNNVTGCAIRAITSVLKICNVNS